ncbi:glycosyltransferase family 2 protein [Halonatronum saccharophilum]|uniref:glycosyltransferase family 2 protein n=1 Tax=Halonatronum saccharophilum TaxID=150060 RepID=UPI0004803A99|nr:glycosyltransferase family 2 protein [Halonatronum saccharophilum]
MQITAVIPAYNEEDTIEGVVNQVGNHKLIDKVIVVSDGSIDDTAQIASQAGAQVIALKENRGKGAAMRIGVDRSKGDIILFLDADLLGLQEEHINSLILPLLDDDIQMSIGIFDDGRILTDLAQKIAPFLSGQRAVKRNLVDQIPHLEMTDFGVEVALTRYINNNDIKYEKVRLKDLSHVMKEEKLGLVKGFSARLKMYWDILKEIPRREKVR